MAFDTRLLIAIGSGTADVGFSFTTRTPIWAERLSSTTQGVPLADGRGFSYFFAPKVVYRINNNSFTEQLLNAIGPSVRMREIGTPDEFWYNMDFASEAYEGIGTRNRYIELVRGSAAFEPETDGGESELVPEGTTPDDNTPVVPMVPVVPMQPDPVSPMVSGVAVPFGMELNRIISKDSGPLMDIYTISRYDYPVTVDSNPFVLTVPFDVEEAGFTRFSTLNWRCVLYIPANIRISHSTRGRFRRHTGYDPDALHRPRPDQRGRLAWRTSVTITDMPWYTTLTFASQ